MSRAEDMAYSSWKAMRQRCGNPKAHGYRFYGGRGITVCDRWLHSFENFLADMGPRPKFKTLDRFPNQNGNYEPGNCRWATKAQQVENTRKRGPLLIPRTPPTILGKRFGRLLVSSYAGIRNRRAFWNCSCDCGATKAVSSNALRRGRTKSCGCFRKDVAVFNLPEARA